MNGDTKDFLSAWRRLWVKDTEAAGPAGALGDPVRMENTPTYPLARTVEMPPGFGYPTGALGFRIEQLELQGFSRLTEERCTLEAEGERIRLRIEFERLTLSGRYTLEAKPDPIITLDTAGDLGELPPEVCQPSSAGAETDAGTLAPQKEEWLDQARAERSRLGQTPNGQKLLGLYNEHNETYDEVFRKNAALPSLWKAGGATKEMSADTSSALKNDSVVNSANKTYKGGVTYNSNAFVQQLNVASACVFQDPSFFESGAPDENGKYWAAAKAAMSFSKGVSGKTNNTKDAVNEMKPSQVYSTVDTHQGGLPEVGNDELNNVISQGMGTGGEGVAVQPGWIIPDEEDRKRIRLIYESTMKQRAEDANVRGKPLFTGRCEARIDGATASLELILEGRRARTLGVEVVLPAFALDIDDSEWTGPAAAVARERIERVYFIRSLLHQSVNDRLKAVVREAGERACTQEPLAR